MSECAGSCVLGQAFDRVLDSLERRYNRAEKQWKSDPNPVNTMRVNTARLALNQAINEYNRALARTQQP